MAGLEEAGLDGCETGEDGFSEVTGTEERADGLVAGAEDDGLVAGAEDDGLVWEVVSQGVVSVGFE